MSKYWIKGAIKHPGAFSAEAKKRGMSTKAYAKANIHTSGLLGKRARLAYILEGMHGGGKSNMKSGGDARTGKTPIRQIG